MARHTVVGVFRNDTQAHAAVSELIGAGVDGTRVRVTFGDPDDASLQLAGREDEAAPGGIGDRIAHFFRSLFGRDDADADTYSEAVHRGSAVVTVDAVDDAEADGAADVMNGCGALDVDEHARDRRETAATRPGQRAGAAPPEGEAREETVVPVVREELDVGKRRVQRGGVRIYTRMTETPAQESVTLREQHARVERRPADRPATEADLAAFGEGTIEVRETVEEPVIEKRVRVVEEVVVATETTARTEQVTGSVRQATVDIEPLQGSRAREAAAPPSGISDADRDADYRRDWQMHYGHTGATYEEYAPAYEYGHALANDDRHRGRRWRDIEPVARRDWDERHPGESTWDRFKASIRHGWERVTGQRQSAR